MNTNELKEVFELLEHENIHLSENNTHIAFVGKYILTNIDLLRGIKSKKNTDIHEYIYHPRLK